MGLVKTRRLAAMQKQQRAKAGMNLPMKKGMLSPLPSSRTRSPVERQARLKALNPTERGEVDA